MAMNNSLAEVHPELITEWSEKNLPLTPDDITFGSNKKVWWNPTNSTLHHARDVVSVNALRDASIRSVMWHCGVREPIMFYIVNTHQLGRTCHFSKKSMKLQLKTEYFK